MTMRRSTRDDHRTSRRESRDIRRTIYDRHLPNCQLAVYNRL
ncbi:hypothetical protein SAMN02745903_04791 [Pseudomonas sp. URMO17WK12:I5]|nr:hypothetical protein H040_04772 [Pseudomonas sp. URMO17WK12:I7]SMF64294.1 hypothetical protein SAMN02745903_04791 [Pseudomonas sp. URMO17WK12:I5]